MSQVGSEKPGAQRIAIEVLPRFVAEQSDPAQNRYVFAYRIVIANEGDVAVRLVSRHWIITDGDHRVQEVRGDGVVGQQPTLEPGERFEYTSGVTLPTPVGTMRGSYRMVAANGTEFDAPVASFTLSVPRVLH
jgi:ApaG protein